MFFLLSDIDECDNNELCASNEECINSQGSFECVCQTGYVQNVAGNCSKCYIEIKVCTCNWDSCKL